MEWKSLSKMSNFPVPHRKVGAGTRFVACEALVAARRINLRPNANRRSGRAFAFRTEASAARVQGGVPDDDAGGTMSDVIKRLQGRPVCPALNAHLPTGLRRTS